MTLAPGTRLGPYQILSPLGAGGMGEVYKAKDTRLERTVAVKVLPTGVSASPEVRQRFEREARTISQLSHPHICALHDVGSQDGVEYLVMEYLEGETLADRLLKGPLAFDQVLRYGIEIADALDKAHRQGIVHRDLKPGNVMLTKSGVKLLDFGLAKAIAPEMPLADLTSNPTAAARSDLTQEGTLLGTLPYMAPEQLEAREADGRTDIFALGATLYEMATGRKAFSGATQASLIGAILHTEPAAISTIQPMTPPTLDRVVKTCLAKDPEERWQSAGDVAKELKWIAEGSPVGVAAPTAVVRKRRVREGLAWAIASLAVLGAAALALRRANHAVELPLRKLEIAAPRLEVEGASPVSLSPDGTKLAYVAGGRLWIRDLRQLEPREVAGSEGAGAPFWSPDREFVGFAVQTKLWKAPAGGGDRVALADLPDTVSAAGAVSWTSDNQIVLALGFTGLLAVSPEGGRLATILPPDPKVDADFHTPSSLPGGAGVLFVVHRSPEGPDTIAVFADKARKTLLRLPGERLWNPVYSPSGHILFERGASYRGVWAMPFSLSRLEVTGKPFLVAQDARFPSAASDGSLAFVRGADEALTQIVWMDRGGQVVGKVEEPGVWTPVPALSHDGRRVAIPLTENGRTEIWILDLDRGTRRRLTSEGVTRMAPCWSPSGDLVAYETGEDQTGIMVRVRRADGTGEAKILARGMGGSFAPDGKTFVYSEWGGAENQWDLAYIRLDGDGKPVILLRAPGAQVQPTVSPDGRYVAYASIESGRSEIEIRPFPVGEGKWQASSSGGEAPRWSQRGDELFYSHDNDVMAVEVKTTPALSLGPPRRLFTREPSGAHVVKFRVWVEGFEVAPDARRFLLLRKVSPRDEISGRTITIVQNWFAEFRGKATP